jgi:branched-chain amino acid transport system substrate-binding protein
MWKWRVERIHPKTIVMIEYDDVTGRAMAKMNADIAIKFPGVKVTQLYLPHGAPDATPIATKIKSLNPDFLYIGSVMGGAEIFRLVKAVHETGWKGHLESTYISVALPEIVEKLGKEVVEGAETEQIKDPSEFTWAPKLLLELRKNYEKKYGVWENDAIGWTGGWYVFQALVKKAGSLDPDVLMDARDGLEFDCLWGRGKLVPRLDMNNSRYVEAVYPKYMGVIKDGKLVHLGTLTVESTLKAAEELYGMPVLPR